MATPFVQGRLRRTALWVDVETRCECCGRGMRLRVDSEGASEIRSEGAEPLIFEPDIDWASFREPTILHDY